MSWTSDKTLEFVEALESEEAIWNPKHEGHKDRNIVHDSWCILQRKFCIPMNELKKKKENLFATYRKYARKVADSMKSGSGTDDIYKPTWFLYDAIDRFLHSVYRPGRTINSMETENENEPEESDADDTTEHETEATNSLPSTSSAQHCEQLAGNLDEKSSLPHQQSQQKKKITKKKCTVAQEITNRMGEALDVLKTVTAQSGKSNSPPKKDRLQLFTDLPLEKLRTSDEATQELAMYEIDNLMFRLRNPSIRRILDSGVLQGHQPSSTSSITHPAAPYYQQHHIFPIYTQPPQQSYYAQPQPSPISHQSQPSPYSQSSASSISQSVTPGPLHPSAPSIPPASPLPPAENFEWDPHL